MAAAPKATEPAGEAAGGVAEAIHKEIKSPMVGTFYAAPSPDAPPYVTVGQELTPDTVVCIIEAMKLMNEIDSEYDGEVISVYVENGQPVQQLRALPVRVVPQVELDRLGRGLGPEAQAALGGGEVAGDVVVTLGGTVVVVPNGKTLMIVVAGARNVVVVGGAGGSRVTGGSM